jgi:hypothetical protein
MALRDELKADSKQRSNNIEEASKVEVAYDEYGEVDAEKTQKNIRKSVRKAAEIRNEGKVKPDRFLWVKMWISYLVSLTMKDRGKIPDNIGDRILITNNMYVTKLYMSTIIQIYELGTSTPITLLGVLNSALRDRGNRAILDATFKNSNYDYDPNNSGLKSRINMWENNLDSDLTSKRMRERSARCLYTVKVAESGKQLKNTRMYLIVRAKDIQTLNNAEKIIFDMLGSMGCIYMPAHGSIRSDLEYISMFGGKNYDLKGTTPVMTTNVILSQIVPNCGSYNDKTGYYVGQNVLNGTPYYIDFSEITVARNMYCVAPSGVGKTVLAMNMAQSAYENGSACVMMDIKGNEYTNFINATNGYTVSLRPMSTEYINSFVMHKEDTSQDNAEAYFKSRVKFSKEQMIILSGVRDRETLLELEELLDEFLDTLYISIGAIPTNMNSWNTTESLNPYEVFDRFEKYLTPQKRAQYNIHKTVIGTLRMFMSATGSKSYVFKREFDYAKILHSDTLAFDFGILGDATISDIDEDLFRLKFLYMSKLNGEFTTRKYAEGKRTFKILEESQVVSDEIMKMYVQEYTLRRSQNQDTLLLGNSVQALQNSEIAKPLIENTRGLFVGELTLDARKVVIEQFGLKHLEDHIKIPGSSNRYKNCFVFINNMQNKNLYPIIQVEVEKNDDGKFKKYKVNTPVKEKNVMSGS